LPSVYKSLEDMGIIIVLIWHNQRI
jgi:hypothetical protein